MEFNIGCKNRVIVSMIAKRLEKLGDFLKVWYDESWEEFR